jgi:hypothetical protein
MLGGVSIISIKAPVGIVHAVDSKVSAAVSVITSNAATDYHFKCRQVRYTFSPDQFQIHADFVTAGNHVSAG